METDAYNTFSRSTNPIQYTDTEVNQLQKRVVRLITRDYDKITEAPDLPSSSEVTSDIFEYDITGIRVKSIGQSTGGLFKELAENESAFSFSIQDETSLFLMHMIMSNENSVSIYDLYEVIVSGDAWLRFSLLLKGGLLDVVGSEIRVTERGMQELNMITQFCELNIPNEHI